MAGEGTFLAQVFRPSYRVIGRRLEPFSVGHAMALEWCQSPFVAGGDQTWPDLALGVVLCSMGGAQAVEAVRTGEAALKVSRLHWKSRFYRGARLRRAFVLFGGYLGEMQDAPEFFLADDLAGPPAGADWWSRLLFFLMGSLNMTEDTALNTPLGWAKFMHCTNLEGKGAMQLVSERHRALFNAEN